MSARNEAYAPGLAPKYAKSGLDLPVSSGVGVTTMFSVLLVLCITVFAVLTFASAQADLRLTKKNAEMVSAYYKADNIAASISAEVTEFWPAGSPKPDIAAVKSLEESIKAQNADVVRASATDTADGIVVAYGIGTDTLLTLDVKLLLPESGICEILSWRMAAEEMSPGKSSLPVWQGN